jgi:foldase protein PrsA
MTLALGAFFVSATAIAACGGGIPGGAVARVGDASISKAAFTHWLTVANASTVGAAPGAPKPPLPDPPNYTNCIAYRVRTAAKPPKGQPNPTPAQFKTQCAAQYGQLRDQVMQFLISADWLQGEARDQGIKVKDSEVTQRFNQIKAQQFPQASAFQQFLQSSGMTIQDLLFRVRLDLLSTKIRTKITNGKDKISQAQISNYYNQNKSRFALSERRDLRLVLTKTKAEADKVKALLSSGQNFKTVAKKYSIDQASKAQGGTLLGVVRGQQEKALDAAVFAAPLRSLQGPVKTQFGYYVFRVQKITPPSQQTLQQATPTIKQLLASQGQQGALTNFVKGFNKRWKGRTKCRAGFVVQSCKNAPTPKSTPGTTGTTPGG